MSSSDAARAAAKARVEGITQGHGYLDEHVFKRMSPDIREKVENSLIRQGEVSRAVKGLVRNLESGSSRFGRFVFDLLRNADDNDFTKARSRHDVPSVTFKIAPSYVTIDCNEDGITPENLTALCNVGQSSRVGSGPYFSEEGIGFKSVFTVAYKVHIQSGSYSFSFNHKPGQPGMGMISPTWEDCQDGPPTGITRIKLFLHPQTTRGTNNSIMQHFEEIQATHLLFLRNIRRINIVYVSDRDRIISSQKYSIRQDTKHLMVVTKEQDGLQKKSNNYHVTKYLVSHIIPHENRGSPKTGGEPKRSWSEVVLAFPLDKTKSQPVTSSQQVFAFSAIGDMGFKFLIQANFVTTNNSQDIDSKSSKNQNLLDWIAISFGEAIQQLGENEDLRYKWMRYLPQKNDHPWEGYWKLLYDRIKSKTKATQLMRHANGIFLYEIERFKRLPLQAMDNEKNPIFEVPFPVMLLSAGYSELDLDLLTEYGLTFLSMADILTRVSLDLTKQNSQMKSAATSDQWHTAAAKFLSFLLEKEWEECSRSVREMGLIPLVNGTWIKASSVVNPLSFASTNGVAIPQDLPLTFISPSATQNVARASLFRHLGAKEPSVSHIRKLIFDKYPACSRPNPSPDEIGLTKDISLEHLKFLYLTHDRNTLDTDSYARIAVFTEGSALRRPVSHDVYYFNNTYLYGTKTLPIPAASSGGFGVDFLAPCYSSGAQWRGEHAWVGWLQTTLGIRTRLRLIDDNVPTPIFRYIMDYKKDELLGVLHYHWPEISRGIQQCPSLAAEIADTPVPCWGEFVELSCTYLPLPDLVASCSEFLDDIKSFPFLDFSNTMAPNDLSAWRFLCDNFSVDDSKSEIFYLDILETIARADHNGEYGENVPAQAFGLYELLYEEINGTAMEEGRLNYIRCMFENSEWPLILLPVAGNVGKRWKEIDNCRWDCPVQMKSLSGLRSHYMGVFKEKILMSTIMPFMRDIVGVSDLSSDDIIKELLLQKQDAEPDGNLIHEMYRRLVDILPAAPISDKLAVRNVFRTSALIFAEQGWHTSDECVWSSDINVPDKIDLSHYYGDVEALLVVILGVPALKMTVDTAYEVLRINGASNSTTIPEMKRVLWQFNSLLLSAQRKPDPRPILESRVFPVKFPGGSVQLLSAVSFEFTIIDQKPLKEKFCSVSKMLDFTLNEVHSLQPFLQWAGLEERLLSAKVTEVTELLRSAESPQESRRDIKSKAYALCRIATHFGSPRTQDIRSLYRLLKTSKVFETPLIKSELRLVEDGCLLKLDHPEAELHFDYTNDALKIYVPNDVSRQDLCFLCNLPHALFEWLMGERLLKIDKTETEVAKRLITNVLNSEPTIAGRLLDREGIVELDFPTDDVNTDVLSQGSPIKAVVQQTRSNLSVFEEKSTVTSGDNDTVGAGTIASSVFSCPSPAGQPQNDENLSSGLCHETAERATSPQLSGSNLPSPQTPQPTQASLVLHSGKTTPSRPSTPQSPEDTSTPNTPNYEAFLDKVIKAARASSLQHTGVFKMSAIEAALIEVESGTKDDNLKHFLSPGDENYQDKIYAAGELYAFELLSNLIPHLPRNVWKSALRKYVAGHPDYHDMEPWDGPEITDIVYTDLDSILTAALVDHGYLDKGTWSGRKPRYYIDVKTTTGECGLPFLMGNGQYTRMCDLAREGTDEEGHEAIYVIFRVYYVGTDFVKHEIYVDPKALESRGMLQFTRGDWEVIPKADTGDESNGMG